NAPAAGSSSPGAPQPPAPLGAEATTGSGQPPAAAAGQSSGAGSNLSTIMAPDEAPGDGAAADSVLPDLPGQSGEIAGSPPDVTTEPAAPAQAPDNSAATAVPAPAAPAAPGASASATPPAAPGAAVPPPGDMAAAAPETMTPPLTAPQDPAAPAADGQAALPDSGIPPAPSLPAAPETEASDTQQTAAIATGTRIRINARLDTWIKITDRTGRTVFNRVLTAGESYDVPEEAGLKMITGNAGGMDILVDGVAIAPLGEPGKVRRDVDLDPEKLKAGTAIPQ
ncbi:MAG TPA: DUF4115 domain-containing protein, partial [Dongiaceae bacterium]